MSEYNAFDASQQPSYYNPTPATGTAYVPPSANLAPQAPCVSCGYCPTCGRKNTQPNWQFPSYQPSDLALQFRSAANAPTSGLTGTQLH